MACSLSPHRATFFGPPKSTMYYPLHAATVVGGFAPGLAGQFDLAERGADRVLATAMIGATTALVALIFTKMFNIKGSSGRATFLNNWQGLATPAKANVAVPTLVNWFVLPVDHMALRRDHLLGIQAIFGSASYPTCSMDSMHSEQARELFLAKAAVITIPLNEIFITQGATSSDIRPTRTISHISTYPLKCGPSYRLACPTLESTDSGTSAMPGGASTGFGNARLVWKMHIFTAVLLTLALCGLLANLVALSGIIYGLPPPSRLLSTHSQYESIHRRTGPRPRWKRSIFYDLTLNILMDNSTSDNPLQYRAFLDSRVTFVLVLANLAPISDPEGHMELLLIITRAATPRQSKLAAARTKIFEPKLSPLGRSSGRYLR